MPNSHRNEITLKLDGKNYNIRATLGLLEEYEERFVTAAEERKGHSQLFRMVGFLLSHSDKKLDEEAGAEVAFNAGLKEASDAVTDFFKVAYKTGDEEEDDSAKKEVAA